MELSRGGGRTTEEVLLGKWLVGRRAQVLHGGLQLDLGWSLGIHWIELIFGQG